MLKKGYNMANIIKKRRYRVMTDLDFKYLYDDKVLNAQDHAWISEALAKVLQGEINKINKDNLIRAQIETYSLPFTVHNIFIDIFDDSYLDAVNKKSNEIFSNISEFIIHLKESGKNYQLSSFDVHLSYLAFFEKQKIENMLCSNDTNDLSKKRRI